MPHEVASVSLRTRTKALSCSSKAVRTESADALPRDLLLDIDLGEGTACVAHVGQVIQFFCAKSDWLAERLQPITPKGCINTRDIGFRV